jgi:hypothetical protein
MELTRWHLFRRRSLRRIPSRRRGSARQPACRQRTHPGFIRLARLRLFAQRRADLSLSQARDALQPDAVIIAPTGWRTSLGRSTEGSSRTSSPDTPLSFPRIRCLLNFPRNCDRREQFLARGLSHDRHDGWYWRRGRRNSRTVSLHQLLNELAGCVDRHP